jgi:hypothetical protein
MYQGATQMDGSRRSRTVVVSSGPSSPRDAQVPRTPAARAADRLARKWRRDCMICMEWPPELREFPRRRLLKADHALRQRRRQGCEAPNHPPSPPGPTARTHPGHQAGGPGGAGVREIVRYSLRICLIRAIASSTACSGSRLLGSSQHLSDPLSPEIHTPSAGSRV